MYVHIYIYVRIYVHIYVHIRTYIRTYNMTRACVSGAITRHPAKKKVDPNSHQKQWKFMYFLKMAMAEKMNLTEDGKP